MKARAAVRFVCALGLACAIACTAPGPPLRAYFPFTSLRGQLFSPPQVLAEARREDFGDGTNAFVLLIDENSSLRAVADAVWKLRERNLAVGYWVDARGAKDASNDFDARLARARAMLENRPPADAIFLAGLQGERLPCGCMQSSCGAGVVGQPSDPLEGARFVAALRGFTGSSIVVPVWQDSIGLESKACADPRCLEAGCARRAELAWISVRSESDRLALRFEAAPAADVAAFVSLRLARWSRLVPPAPLLRGRTVATLVAVLPGLDWERAQLVQAVGVTSAIDHGGFLVSYCPLTPD